MVLGLQVDVEGGYLLEHLNYEEVDYCVEVLMVVDYYGDWDSDVDEEWMVVGGLRFSISSRTLQPFELSVWL